MRRTNREQARGAAGAVLLAGVAGLIAAGAAWPARALAEQAAAAAVPSYTNDDLERVRPLRGETGVTSQPAFAPAGETEGACADDDGGPRRGRRRRTRACATASASTGSAGAPARGETYWRREAQRVRERVRRWREQIDDLKLRIDERRRKPGVRPYSDPQIVGWQRRVEALEARVRELQGELSDRARRERALPGWLR